ncbi:MAG: VOC family protein [Parachlamydiaceae bacterium]|nr:VOC family protein [Parachlamydiaceae bacterium]
MKIKSIDLAWIVVKDLNQSVKFYTEKVGLKLIELNEGFGWAELQGENGGVKLGLAQVHPTGNEGIIPGNNAVVTLTVDSIEDSVADLSAKGVKLIGEMQEVPGHVKLQMVQDEDGNHIQLVECLYHKCSE